MPMKWIRICKREVHRGCTSYSLLPAPLAVNPGGNWEALVILQFFFWFVGIPGPSPKGSLLVSLYYIYKTPYFFHINALRVGFHVYFSFLLCTSL